MSNLVNNINSAISKLPIVDGSLSVFLNIDGKQYDVEQFKVGFSQHIDHKGEPQIEVSGGILVITLTQVVPESFYSWSIDNNKYKDGLVYFELGDQRKVLKIEFYRARCISLNRTLTIGKGVQSIIAISPETIKLNGIEHYNNWDDE